MKHGAQAGGLGPTLAVEHSHSAAEVEDKKMVANSKHRERLAPSRHVLQRPSGAVETTQAAATAEHINVVLGAVPKR